MSWLLYGGKHFFNVAGKSGRNRGRLYDSDFVFFSGSVGKLGDKKDKNGIMVTEDALRQ